MGRAPCCEEVGVKKGPWTAEEDKVLVEYIQKHGHGSWRRLPKQAGLNRCGKSCRLRWTNYLRPDIKRGRFSDDEEKLIIHLHSVLGNKWSSIATKLPGRTDNEIKNYWNTHLRKKLLGMGIDPVTHRPRADLNLLAAGLPGLLAAANLGGALAGHGWDNALKLQADAANLAKLQLLQSLVQVLATTTTAAAAAPPGADLMALIGAASGGGGCSFPGSAAAGRYDGLTSFGLPALTAAASAPAMAPGLGFASLLNSFAEPRVSVPACDGLSSTELGASCSNMTALPPPAAAAAAAAAAASDAMAATAAPALVSASPDNCNHGGGCSGGDTVNSYGASAGSPASSPFDGLESLNVMDDLSIDGGWRELLDHMSYLNPSEGGI